VRLDYIDIEQKSKGYLFCLFIISVRDNLIQQIFFAD